jgi:hypothetical protein
MRDEFWDTAPHYGGQRGEMGCLGANLMVGLDCTSRPYNSALTALAMVGLTAHLRRKVLKPPEKTFDLARNNHSK